MDDVRAFLRRKGGTELLCVIQRDGSRHGELVDTVDISRATLSKRLDEAQTAGIIELTAQSRDLEGAVPLYVLTPLGEFLQDEMEREGVIGAYQHYRAARETYYNRREAMREAAEKMPNLHAVAFKSEPLYADEIVESLEVENEEDQSNGDSRNNEQSTNSNASESEDDMK